MNAFRRLIALSGALAFFVGNAALAAPDCSVAVPLTPLQMRVAAKAAEGPDALRRFVVTRQAIYQFNVGETMEEGMRHQDWSASCGRAVADATKMKGAAD